MKRALPRSLRGDFEVFQIVKVPKREDNESLQFEFTPSKQHAAAVDFIYSSAIDYLKSAKCRNFLKLTGELGFSFQFTDDLMEKDYSYSCGAEMLREMVSQIENRIAEWIKYIDQYIFNVKRKTSHALQYTRLLAWTPKGTVDYHETAKRLLDSPDLSFTDKLKIASVHCLVDEIENYITNDVVENLPDMFEKTEVIVHFWKNYAVKKAEGVDVADILGNERLLHAVGYENQSAVTFVWNNLNDSSKSNNILQLVEKCDIDFIIYSLSQMDKIHQLEIFEEHGAVVVHKMMNDFVWDKYIYVVLSFARDVISNPDYYLILRAASARSENASWSSKNGELFHSIWSNAPQRVRDYIFDEIEAVDLFTYISKDPCESSVEKLFAEISQNFKKPLLQSSHGIRMVQELIYNGEFYFVKSLIDQSFDSEQEAYEFKKLLVKEYDVEPLYESLSNKATIEELNDELRWYFATDQEANEFKKKFIRDFRKISCLSAWLQNIVCETRKTSSFEGSIPRERADFVEMNDLLDWLSLSPPEIQNVKKVIAKEDMFESLITQLVNINRYDLAEQLLQWCLPDEAAIKQFKTSFFRAKTNANVIDHVLNSLWKSNDLQSLDNYVNWAFDQQSEKDTFKRSILESSKTSTSKLWGCLLYAQKFELADRLLKWCGLVTDDEILRYKKELMLEIDLNYVTDRVVWSMYFFRDRSKNENDQQEERCNSIVRWFNPSLLTLARLRRKYPSKNADNKTSHWLFRALGL